MPNQDNRSIRCSFCGKKQEQVERIIAGPSAYICNECIQLCLSILEGEEERAERPLEAGRSDIHDIPTPQEIHAVLDEYIIGQDEAKIAMSVAVYNHYKRIFLVEKTMMWSCKRATSCSWGPPVAVRPCLLRPWPAF